MTRGDIEEKTTNRIALIALLISIIFGISYYYQGQNQVQKFDTVGVDFTLSVMANSLFIVLPMFLIYILGLSMDYRHISKKSKTWYLPFYDLGIVSSCVIIVMVFVSSVLLIPTLYFQLPDIFVYGFPIGVLITTTIFAKALAYPLIDIIRHILEIFKNFFYYFMDLLRR